MYSSSKLGVKLVEPQVGHIAANMLWKWLISPYSTLLVVMLQFEHNIKALASRGDLTFAAVKSDIVVCRRVHRWLFILALESGGLHFSKDSPRAAKLSRMHCP